MSDLDPVESRKVTLEDLLRLKRAERPAPEFWTQFEEELRAKQLAAIIQKQPWWRTLSLSQATRQLARVRIPAGVAAVLALSAMTVREYRWVPASPIPAAPVVELASAAPVPHAEQPQQVTLVVIAQDGRDEPERIVALEPTDSSVEFAVEAAIEPAAKSEPAPVIVAVADTAPAPAVEPTAAKTPSAVALPPGGLMAMIPWMGASAEPAGSQDRPSVLAELPQVHFAAAAFPGLEHDFEGRVEVDPVVLSASHATHVAVSADHDGLMVQPPASPSALRRHRILSSIEVADHVASEGERSRLAHVRELIAGTLDEERLYDNVRRLGMGGDRLTLKF